MSDPTWRPANNGTGKYIYFLYRDDPSWPIGERYHCDKRGSLIRYKNHETAQRAADRLNSIAVDESSCDSSARQVAIANKEFDHD